MAMSAVLWQIRHFAVDFSQAHEAFVQNPVLAGPEGPARRKGAPAPWFSPTTSAWRTDPLQVAPTLAMTAAIAASRASLDGSTSTRSGRLGSPIRIVGVTRFPALWARISASASVSNSTLRYVNGIARSVRCAYDRTVSSQVSRPSTRIDGQLGLIRAVCRIRFGIAPPAERGAGHERPPATGWRPRRPTASRPSCSGAGRSALPRQVSRPWM